ncbi:hypothetical protein M6D93_04025 [Jatrophihabitans telluris]|uniref:Uncharacterized protein n=1 Tax=Jatrophihabitans telluris TaxID=2038343 RepID=A0ABY4R0Y2_9ACTN|nr:hypothetical protein [Jatrophihabitans telluris]UQX89177.1 hypothetical protein M6D93_04025 [Jatrophihabitans telluris]
MPTTRPHSETAQPVGEQFLGLVLADSALLAAEFDAIIAAEWPAPPAERPGRDAAGRHPVSGPTRRTADPVRGPGSGPRPAGIDGWVRQRSPPIRRMGPAALTADPTHARQARPANHYGEHSQPPR